MARYGRRSMGNLEGVHPLLVDWALELVTIIDNSVIDGVRDMTQQRLYVSMGVSQTMNSLHLIQPDGYSHAVDLAPYPIDWSDHRRFYIMGGIGLGLASKMDLPIVWGGRFNPDDDRFKMPSLNDIGHFQIMTDYNPNPRDSV
jgi:peptidoglycan L-alanyl-D-glutamate endopeptidase CwlK